MVDWFLTIEQIVLCNWDWPVQIEFCLDIYCVVRSRDKSFCVENLVECRRKQIKDRMAEARARQDRFTTCFKICGTGSLFWGVEWGFKVPLKLKKWRPLHWRLCICLMTECAMLKEKWTFKINVCIKFLGEKPFWDLMAVS